MTDPPVDKVEIVEPPVIVVGKTGPPGATGRTGARGVGFSRLQVLTLFAFVVAVFLLLAYRNEVNGRDIRIANHDTAMRLHEQCELSHANAKSLTKILDQVITAVSARKDLPSAVKQQYIASYSAARPRVVDCGPVP